ncbi:MAG: signal recognition particle-docking protein FtsY [Melioribacteraceae bacterium]|nr:signal recognition particle-docking protein FtsY [Melioribacteraceae bacterium]MCF8264661.1 signal recognition particle-docking protein FtsY [Melioribacteraceae bacterium]
MALFSNINFEKLRSGLSKTRNKFINNLNEAFTGIELVNEDTLDEVESILISSDIGSELSESILDMARIKLKEEKDLSKDNFLKLIKHELGKVLTKNADSRSNSADEMEKYKPYVILIVGVNGAGKTTTIGKLASNFKNAGKKVIIGSADTFRAAANEQLEVWAGRAGVEIISGKMGSDPSSVAFATMEAANKMNADVVFIDTAGRLHTKNDLMHELSKIERVIKKVVDHAPNEAYLVVDGNSGQNALTQAREFSKFSQITGLIVTKLDGTAKGGMIFQICNELQIPVKYIGVGEGIDDLQDFDKQKYLDALFNEVA